VEYLLKKVGRVDLRDEMKGTAWNTAVNMLVSLATLKVSW